MSKFVAVVNVRIQHHVEVNAVDIQQAADFIENRQSDFIRELDKELLDVQIESIEPAFTED